MANSKHLQMPNERSWVHYDAECKAVMANVLKVCKEEKQAGAVQIPVMYAVERTAHYTGVSECTIYRLQVQKPPTQRKIRRDKVTLDEFDLCVVRRTLHDLLVVQKRLPTVDIVRKRLQESIQYQGGEKHLRRTLHELGFSWKKTQSNRSILMERADVVNSRVEFLRKIKKLREDGRTIVYTDETFVHSAHTMHRSWQSKDISLKVPFSKGQRLIIVHAGTEAGFIKGASLVFKAHSSTGDYHDEMNGTNFLKWLNEKLIPNMPARSVLIVDNAPYHNLQTDKCPVQGTLKADVQAWLRRHNIVFEPGMLKPQLLNLCKINKPAPTYVLDSTLRAHGHDCLRLPPYHADLNAIELVWAQVKGRIARNNTTFKMTDVLQQTQDSIEAVSAADWKACCEHVQKAERKYALMDIVVDNEMDRIIIQVTSSDEGTDTASDVDDDVTTATASEGEIYNSETDTADEC